MKIDIPVSQPYSVDIAPGLLDDLGRYVSSGTAALVVTEEHVAPLLLERACRAIVAEYPIDTDMAGKIQDFQLSMPRVGSQPSFVAKT